MGKNQAYKAMQRSRIGSTSGADPSEIEDGMVDGSFHTPEWHAARLASLNTSHTVTWEEYKKKQKEDALKKGELEADTDRMMRQYRAQLDAERERKLSQGRNRTSSKSAHKKDKKDKDSRKHRSKKRKRSRRSSDSSSSSSSASSDDEERESRKSRSRSKRSKKEKKSRSRSKHYSSDDDGSDGPVPLSRFFGSVKS